MSLQFYKNKHHPINWTQTLLGMLALISGLIFYIFYRPAENIYFIPQALSLYEGTPSPFGQISGYLPTFLHVIAFSLLIAGVSGCGKRGAFNICFIWMLINGCFELGQHQEIAPGIAEIVPEWFSYIPILSNTSSYFIDGVFDPYDLLSTVIGTVVAYITIRLTTKNKGSGKACNAP